MRHARRAFYRPALVLTVTILSIVGSYAESTEEELEAAFFLESTSSDIDEALRAYQRILERADVTVPIAARAWLRIGICHALAGRGRDARTAWRRVSEEFASETETVNAALRALEEARDHPARFAPPDALLYVEWIRPEEHIPHLVRLLRGTPFQNPVDVYRSYLERSTTRKVTPDESDEGAHVDTRLPSVQRTGAVREASAVLNEGFLRELGKIDGLSLVVLDVPDEEPRLLVILEPGESDIARGLVQFTLAVTGAHLVTDPVHEGFPVFQTVAREGEGATIAIGEDVVLIGNSGEAVNEAIVRYTTGGASLEGVPAFRSRLRLRPGSFVFSYLSVSHALDVVRSQQSEFERRQFDAARSGLELDSIRALHLSVALDVAADELSVTAETTFERDGHPAWSLLRTPPVRPGGIDPPGLRDALASMSFDMPRASDWSAATRTLLESFLEAGGTAPELPADSETGSGDRNESASGETRSSDDPNAVSRTTLESAPLANAYVVLDELESVRIGLRPLEPRRPPLAGFFAALRFATPERGLDALEQTIRTTAHDILRSPASIAFSDHSIEARGETLPARRFEPLPGVELFLAQRGEWVVLARSEENVTAWSADQSETPGGEEPPATGPSKVFRFHPAALVRSLARSEIRTPTRVLFANIAEISAVSYESESRLRVEGTIPDLVETTRRVLEGLARE